MVGISCSLKTNRSLLDAIVPQITTRLKQPAPLNVRRSGEGGPTRAGRDHPSPGPGRRRPQRSLPQTQRRLQRPGRMAPLRPTHQKGYRARRTPRHGKRLFTGLRPVSPL